MGKSSKSRSEPKGRNPKRGRNPLKGRPFGPELRKKFLDFVTEGAHCVDFAARLTGVSVSTIYRWLELGREAGAHHEHKAFAAAFDEATAKLGHHAVKQLDTLSKSDGPAAVKAAEILARHYHPTFRNKARDARDVAEARLAKVKLAQAEKDLKGGGSKTIVLGVEGLLADSRRSEAFRAELQRAIEEGQIQPLTRWNLGAGAEGGDDAA